MILHSIIIDMSQGRGIDIKKWKDSWKNSLLGPLKRIKGFQPNGSATTTPSPMAPVGFAGANLSVNSLSNISEQLLNLGKGKNIQRVSFWTAFILCALLTADLLALLVEKYLPSPPISTLSSRMNRIAQGSGPLDYEIIANRNLFSSKVVAKNKNELDLESEPVLTTLPLQLIGTVIFKNPARSLAAIQDKTENKVYPVRMGDEILDKVQILSD